MKKLVLAGVSAVALLAIGYGPAMANDGAKVNAGIAVQLEDANVGPGVALSGAQLNANHIDDNAFQQAVGAYNVSQNSGANSSVQSGMAIGAVIDKCGCGHGTDLALNGALAASALSSTVSWNGSLGVFQGNFNEISDNAFQKATGAFNVSQNTGANSVVQNSTAIAAVISGGH